MNQHGYHVAGLIGLGMGIVAIIVSIRASFMAFAIETDSRDSLRQLRIHIVELSDRMYEFESKISSPPVANQAISPDSR